VLLLPSTLHANRVAPPVSHPRLLFSPEDVPALRNKVHDGGEDDAAYAYIRDLTARVYPGRTLAEQMDVAYGIEFPLNLGLVAYLENPEDTAAMALGRSLTLQLVDDFDPDANVFYSPIRLRILAFGYDFFFGDAPEPDRTRVRNEMLAYVDTIMTNPFYEKWLFPPYVSNISSMIASSLGLAAMCLVGEIPVERLDALLARADQYIDRWMTYHLDAGGSYDEGAMYAGWSLRNLVPYFWARRRYDGVDYSQMPSIRGIERWLAYALLPEGRGEVNNLNDASYLNYPWSRLNTYLDWAQTAWRSELAAWLWGRLVGPPYGVDAGEQADKAATVLWYRGPSAVNPGEMLPGHFLWKHRGLYYFRSGWPDGPSSDDIVFSFYSGKFHGGHAQEDQNHFTLYAYGAKFAVDNGFDVKNSESAAHNMIFIDGKGQYNAGSSIGTDGDIREHLLSGFADYLFGDATRAYTTHSDFNDPGVPFPDDDWSYGYEGANPVNFAYRRWIVVHGEEVAPYFLLVDDIEKDGDEHEYAWRMHTLQDNQVDIVHDPMRLGSDSGVLDVHVLSPTPDAQARSSVPYDNESVDPNTTIITVSQVTRTAEFAFLLIPHAYSTGPASVRHANTAWGLAAVIDWGDVRDRVILNRTASVVDWPAEAVGDDPASAGFRTDAELLVVRTLSDGRRSWLATDMSLLEGQDRVWARVSEGRVSLAATNDALVVSRVDAQFRVFGPNIRSVRFEDDAIAFRQRDGYVVPFAAPDNGYEGGTPLLTVRVFPNPFNPSARILLEAEQRTRVDVRVYDVTGSLVATLFDGQVDRGTKVLDWDGTRPGGSRAASGVYYVRARSGNSTSTARAVLLR